MEQQPASLSDSAQPSAPACRCQPGGPGDDYNDELQGGGGRGADDLRGESGNDRLVGGFDADRLSGGPGNDRITSVDGERDTVDCGSGRDVAIVDRRDRVRSNCERVKCG